MQKGNFSVISKGKHKNKKIPMPPPVKNHFSITPNKVKEAIFQIFDNNIHNVDNSLFVDLFAGSGQIGFEAVSRGFAGCIFFDISGDRQKNLKNWSRLNLLSDMNKCFFEKKDGVREFPKILGNTEDYLQKHGELQWIKHIAIFADPPYGLKYKQLLILEILIDLMLNVETGTSFSYTILIQTNADDLGKSGFSELESGDKRITHRRIFRKFAYGRHRLLLFGF
ncbi:MAG: RsmD family RNA methyltransferase [Spirochaetia bacterium]|nr:RsmD family RNA methyltransferase [Spirochaetia bacterium]